MLGAFLGSADRTLNKVATVHILREVIFRFFSYIQECKPLEGNLKFASESFKSFKKRLTKQFHS